MSSFVRFMNSAAHPAGLGKFMEHHAAPTTGKTTSPHGNRPSFGELT
jgi:hypothetical protein